jgi:hypothetical protein
LKQVLANGKRPKRGQEAKRAPEAGDDKRRVSLLGKMVVILDGIGVERVIETAQRASTVVQLVAGYRDTTGY